MANGNKPHLEIVIDRSEFFRWQQHVIEVVTASPDVVATIVAAPEAPPTLPGLDLLFAFERVFVGADRDTAVDRVAPPESTAAATPDLILDLTGRLPPQTRAPVLRATCLGLPPLVGAIVAVLDDRSPTLEFERVEPSGEVRHATCWRVGVEDRHNTLLAVSQILGRLAHGVLVALDEHVRDAERGGDPGVRAERRAAPNGAASLRLLTRAVASRVLRRLERRLREPPDWRVIWRRRDPATAPLAPETDPTPFRLLPDDGRRFYADPFVVSEAGRTWLFVEEFPYATGRGVLSLAEIAPDEAIGTPRPFLEQGCHLSYPQIFAEAGTFWMIPETSGRRTVELWRAVAFPDRWERHAVLLEDVDVGDATVVRRDGRWWMFGCRRERWCSSWDALDVWQAPSLAGPWTPIARSPAKVDVASARPAGAMIETAAGLMRPVQDSSRGYGCGLALARVDRLDETGFAETILQRFVTPPPLHGLHTWNRAATPNGLVEVMDIFARARDFGASRRLDLGGRPSTGVGFSKT